MRLPPQWTLAQLGDLATRIVGGGTPSKALSANFEGAIPFMTVKDMKTRFVDSTVDHISEDAISASATTIVPADTLIVATRMSLGKIVRPKVDVAINQDLKALFLREGVEKTFIEYFWRSKSQAIQAMGTGTTVKGIRLEDIRALAVPLAPMNEQKRIADKLDAVLTRVDAVNTRLARVAPLLKRFRQSVLAAATSGRLTGEWRLANDLSYPQALTLGELIKVSSGDGLTAKEMKPEGSVPVYGGNGINGHHDQSNVSAPTIVIGRVGFYCGSVHLTPSIAWITDNALRVKFDPAKLDRKYLYFALQGTDLRQNMSSTAQPVISGQKIYPLSFNLPTLLEQTEIVRRVETLFAFADRLEARLQAAQTATNRLTPALLAKAFRGELVPQDPNDEPACELLRRLQQEAPKTGTKRERKSAA
jgi:type I restriction enzyme S subunit